MLSIGQKLSRARTERELTIEDVAFYTHIPAGRLRDMENDDLSRFANLTYARGFLKIYSRFLDLDISDYLEQFSTSEMAHASGHEYVQMANATQNLPAAVFTDYGRARRPGLYILMTLSLVAGAIVWWNNASPPSDGSHEQNLQPPPSGTDTLAESSTPPAPRTRPAELATPPAEVRTEEMAAKGAEPPINHSLDFTPARPSDVPVKPPKAAVIEEDEAPPSPSNPKKRPQ